MPVKRKVALLWGGGKESLLALHHLIENKKSEILSITLIHYNYGQLSFKKEQQSQQYYAAEFSKLDNVRVDGFSSGNGLVNMIDVPLGILRGNLQSTHVVNRNLIFISLAVNYCVNRGIRELVAPFTKEFTMGDSSIDYLNLVKPAIKAVYPLFRLYSPFEHSSIISHKLLVTAKVDLSHVWSCDSKGHTRKKDFTHCSRCSKCVDFLTKVPDTKEYLKLVKYQQYVNL